MFVVSFPFLQISFTDKNKGQSGKTVLSIFIFEGSVRHSSLLKRSFPIEIQSAFSVFVEM